MGKQKDEIVYNVGCPDWMMTFGDCMSLLLTFFVLLLSFSSPDKNKLLDMLGGIQGALGILPVTVDPIYGQTNAHKEDTDEESKAGGPLEGGSKEKISIDMEDAAPANLHSLKIINRLNVTKERLEEAGFKHLITLGQTDQGISLQINMDSLFKKGSETPNPDAGKLIEEFSALASSVKNEIRLTACFKPDKGGDRFMNEWNLARKRTFAIGDLIAAKRKMLPYRFSYGAKILDGDRPEYIEIVLAEKVGISQMNLAEFMAIDKKK